MSPIYDKARLKAFMAEWSDTKHPEEAVTAFCQLITAESGVKEGSRVQVTRGEHDGTELVVTQMNAAEAEVYASPAKGGAPSGWWPVEAVKVVGAPSGRKPRVLAGATS